MAFDPNNPTPGTMTEKVFNLLVADTEISSAGAINALRAYYVQGLSGKDAYSQYGVSRSYFSQSLKRLNKRIQDWAEIVAVLVPDRPHQATTTRLLVESQAMVSDLQSKLTAALATENH